MAGLSWIFRKSTPQKVPPKAPEAPIKPEQPGAHTSNDFLFKKPTVAAPAATAVSERVKPVTAAPQGEQIKLVIWDLDDTFWTGTLAEGGITIIDTNMNVVRELTSRGIVNSICSKNEFQRTKAELERHDIWDQFIFPQIAFEAKGALIRNIIEAAQLRAPNVLFIDDNPMNINEAVHYSPGLQVCTPEKIRSLLNDPRCKGKPDPGHARLANYKVLEKKNADQTASGGDNREFLRQSEIRVSLHHDVIPEFPRIHDLVNRSNQLNFTKNRWPEDLEAAAVVFKEQSGKFFYSHSGYVKVADRYGSYGIVGFYLIQGQKEKCLHFLFSCRTLNMGVEQFVWHQLNRPEVKVVGEVVSKLDDKPDWITLVDDADEQIEVRSDKIKVCLRGACDMAMISHYLRVKHTTIEEFNYDFDGWIISPVARAVALEKELQVNHAAQDLVKRLPGMPPTGFKSCINSGEADIYVMSFSPEWFPTYYRSNSTDLLFPISSWPLGGVNFATTEFSKVAGKARGTSLNEEKWRFLQSELAHCGPADEKQLAAEVQAIFDKLSGKLVIVVSLNVRYGSDWMLINRLKRIESIVMPVVRASGCHVIDLGEFVRGPKDLANAKGGHFKREVYHGLATRILEIIDSERVSQPVEQLALTN